MIPHLELLADSVIGTTVALAIHEAFVKQFVVKRTQIASKRVLKRALGLLDEHVYSFGIQDLDQAAVSILESLFGPGQYEDKLSVESLLDFWSVRKYYSKMSDRLNRAQNGVPLETEYDAKVENETIEFQESPALAYSDSEETLTATDAPWLTTQDWWFGGTSE